MTLQINSASLEDTIKFGERVGARCKGGEVFLLISDLGGGKTALTRGLARGLKALDDVTSPSFTINNIYHGPNLSLQHFDFYRLSDPGVMADELIEAINEKNNVVVVEWGDNIVNLLPGNKTSVHITPTSDSTRQFKIIFYEDRNYLFEGMNK